MPSLPPSAERKSQQRKLWKDRRLGLSEHQRWFASQTICRSIEEHPSFANCQHLAAYVAMPDEVDLQSLIGFAEHAGKQVWVPRLKAGRMDFAAWNSHAPMEVSALGTRQPKANAASRPATAMDLVLLPLLAFTRSGRRLGMGGGYYDRAFSFMLQREPGDGPLMSGVAFSCQQAGELPNDPWDVPLAQVVTENEWINCG